MARYDRTPLLYYVSDKDLFDGLCSSAQQFSEASLRHLSRTRGIYYSEDEDRLTLCDRIACLAFGFHEISAVRTEFERAGRGERTSSFRLKTALSLDEMKTLTNEYVESAVQRGEKLTSRLVGESGFALNVKYNEVDLSRTTLRQIQPKEASIEIKVVGDETIVTYASNEKAKSLALALSKRVNSVRASAVEVEEVDLSSLRLASAKSAFFYKLVTQLDGFKMEDVTSLKVDTIRSSKHLDDSEIDDAEKSDAESKEMLGVVKAVALHGESLLSSQEYQNLQRRGFFISSIQWSARRIKSPFEIVEFDANFLDPIVGTGFRYSVRGWATQRNGNYIKNFKPLPPEEKKSLLMLVETTAHRVCRELRSEALSAKQNPTDGNSSESEDAEALAP